jgi:hypothetical protein
MSFPPQSPVGSFPPPHRILYECLNDRETKTLWDAYKSKYADQCEFEEVDAAVSNSMDDFARWFGQWIAFAPAKRSTRVRVLLIWHAHFLSLACQQMLRRSLEQRSFRCRVWFHIEEPLLQSAIVSRCIVTTVPAYSHQPNVEGQLDSKLWDNPRTFETELQAGNK